MEDTILSWQSHVQGDERMNKEALVGEDGEPCSEHFELEVSLGHKSWKQIWRFPGEAGA